MNSNERIQGKTTVQKDWGSKSNQRCNLKCNIIIVNSEMYKTCQKMMVKT
jgi:hypothetical protein